MQSKRCGAAMEYRLAQKLLVIFYREWTYYWHLQPISCVTRDDHSYVEFEDFTVATFALEHGRGVLKNIDCAGKELICLNDLDIPVPGGPELQPEIRRVLRLLLAQLAASTPELSEQAKGRKEPEQKWELTSAGEFLIFENPRDKLLFLNSTFGESQKYRMIYNAPEEYFLIPSKSAKPSENVLLSGGFRKHNHFLESRTVQNLDLFPTNDVPTLLRLQQVPSGRGFKAFGRKGTRVPLSSHTP